MLGAQQDTATGSGRLRYRCSCGEENDVQRAAIRRGAFQDAHGLAARRGRQGQQRGATKAGLGLEDIRSLSIPVPPRSEQDEIARRVDHILERADALTVRVGLAEGKVDRSTQSLLAKVFRSELALTD